MRRAVLVLLLAPASAFAQEDDGDLPPPMFGGEEASETPSAPVDEPDGPTLGRYLEAMSQQRLIADETGSAERLQRLVRTGEELYFDGRYDEAALVLYEVVESPRFADFSGLDEFAGAELMIAGALAELGSLRSALRYLERILRRGEEDPYYGPAYRRFVDVALQSGELDSAVARLEAVGAVNLPEDAENELRYLRSRAHYDAGRADEAEAGFAEITQRSRFYANAQYFRGVLAAREGSFDEAEDRFCSIATTGDQERFTFYVDDRFFEVKDLAWLGLGRVAHEGGRSDDAFYYYFQVPNDSERVAEALFEAAFAMYEGDDHDTAIDLLDQLEARFPASPFVDEAMLLRGYVHLGRCEFEEANQLFVRFAERFSPLVAEIREILESETRQSTFYQRLLDEERRLARLAERERSEQEQEEDARAQISTLQGLMLALLRVDPTFYELHSRVRTLDAEAARAGRLAADFRGLAARLGGTEAPQAAAQREQFRGETEELRQQLQAATAILEANAAQLDTLRRGGATPEQLRPFESELRSLRERTLALEERLRAAVAASAESESYFAGGDDDALRALLREDATRARAFPRRVREMRERLVSAANEAALRSLNALFERLGGNLRRGRIGRIDAIMGSKRRIEIQIQSLAAGRFPAELVDPLQIQGLLRDDEEYWPFEGELWADEFQETDPLDEEDLEAIEDAEIEAELEEEAAEEEGEE